MWILYVTLYTIIILALVFVFYLIVIGFTIGIVHILDALEKKHKKDDNSDENVK